MRSAPEVSLREVMATFTTGVTVLTTPGEQGHAMTANAFTSLSIDPPMVLCCIATGSRMYEAVVDAEALGVSILAPGQEALARWFADGDRPRGDAQFSGIPHRPGPVSGAPVLEAASAWLDCTIEARHVAGDHVIVVAGVRAAGVDPAVGDASASLLFRAGRFHLFEPSVTDRAA